MRFGSTPNALMAENVAYYLRKGFVETHRASDAGYERVYFSKRLSAQIDRDRAGRAAPGNYTSKTASDTDLSSAT